VFPKHPGTPDEVETLCGPEHLIKHLDCFSVAPHVMTLKALEKNSTRRRNSIREHMASKVNASRPLSGHVHR